MIRTFNRQPITIGLSSSEKKNTTPNILTLAQFKGLSDIQNDVVVDQQTFSEIKNLYIDENYQLVSRKPFDLDDDYCAIIDEQEFNGYRLRVIQYYVKIETVNDNTVITPIDRLDDTIIDTNTTLGICTSILYISDNTYTYTETGRYSCYNYIRKLESFMALKEIFNAPKIKMEQVKDKVFIFVGGFDIICFNLQGEYDENTKTYIPYFEDAAQYIYLPELKVNGINLESENLFTSVYKSVSEFYKENFFTSNEITPYLDVYLQNKSEVSYLYNTDEYKQFKSTFYTGDNKQLLYKDLIYPTLDLGNVDFTYQVEYNNDKVVIFRYNSTRFELSINGLPFEYIPFQSYYGEPHLTKQGDAIFVFGEKELFVYDIAVKTWKTHSYFEQEKVIKNRPTLDHIVNTINPQGYFENINQFVYLIEYRGLNVAYTQQVIYGEYLLGTQTEGGIRYLIAVLGINVNGTAEFDGSDIGFYVEPGVSGKDFTIIANFIGDISEVPNLGPIVSVMASKVRKLETGGLITLNSYIFFIQFGWKKLENEDKSIYYDARFLSYDKVQGIEQFFYKGNTTSTLNTLGYKLFDSNRFILNIEKPTIKNTSTGFELDYDMLAVFGFSHTANGKAIGYKKFYTALHCTEYTEPTPDWSYNLETFFDAVPYVGIADTEQELSVITADTFKYYYDENENSILTSFGKIYLESKKMIGPSINNVEALYTYRKYLLQYPVESFIPLYNGNDNIFFKKDTKLWSNTFINDLILRTYEYVNLVRQDDKVFIDLQSYVPNYHEKLDTDYFSFEIENKHILGVTAYRYAIEDLQRNDVLLYLPIKDEEQFNSKITNLHSIADNILGIFTDNDTYYMTISNSESNTIRYAPVKSKLPIGCREGNEIITVSDGQAILMMSEQGIAYLQPQDFVATTERVLNYITNNILNNYRPFYNEEVVNYNISPRIKVTYYNYYMLFYKYLSNEILILDTRSNTWWKWSTPYPICKIYQIKNKLKFLFLIDKKYDFNLPDLNVDWLGGCILSLTDKNNYRDTIIEDTFNDNGRIDWGFATQKLHFDAINNYKIVKGLNIISQAKNKFRARLSTKVYRNYYHPEQSDVIEVEINDLRTFVQRMNLMHLVNFELVVQNDYKDEEPEQLILNSIGIKYEVKEVIR